MVAVPYKFERTVTFLCVDVRQDDGLLRSEPRATGFFVRVPIEDSKVGDRVDYVVTARHCIEKARAEGHDTIYIRFNKADGQFMELATNGDDWAVHDSADVASILVLRSALPPGMKPDDLETGSLALSHFVGPGPEYIYRGHADQVGEVEIQPRTGHEVYMLGLFSQHYGREERRNIPIARFGHIAQTPNRIRIKDEEAGIEIDTVAYLMEFESWAGHSGSPVFFWYPMMLVTEVMGEDDNVERTIYNSLHVSGFIGLVTGHFPVPEEQDLKGFGKVEIKMNSGIAIVTPAEAVTQLLMRDDFVAKREELKKQVESSRPTPTLDSGEARGEFSRSDEAGR